MTDNNHAEWLKEGVKPWNRRRKKVSFLPDLSGINFFDFLPNDFRDAPKTSRYFEKINLSGANLNDANLSGLNFRNAKFDQANLSNADLSLSNFEKSSFKNANLSFANASKSLFLDSNFEKANLKDADFSEAILEDAIFIDTLIAEEQSTEIEFANMKNYANRIEYLEAKKDRLQMAYTSQSSSDPESKVDKRKKKNRYDVYFATNRNPIYERGELSGFGSINTQELAYGISEVIVPEGHRVGSLGSSLWKRLLNRQDDRLRLDNITSLNELLFWEFIKETSANMKLKEHPVLFIHGFNNTFESAILRAAQIGYDLGIGQGIGLFSWPSKGNAASYNADEASAENSKYLLASFIETFTSNSPTGKINIIAHSMGCRCLIGALEQLSWKNVNSLKKLNQIIMAAADIDTAIMPQQGKIVTKHCSRFTSYASGLDKALKVSGWLHEFPRVGITPPTFVLNGIDTVVVNDLNLGTLSHGYVGSSRTVLNDIFELLKNNTDPSERFGIEAAVEATASFWKIKN